MDSALPLVLLAAAALLVSRNASAELMVEDSFFYDISGVTSSSSDSYSKIFDSLFAGATFGSGFYIGWTFNYVTRSNAISGTTTSLSGYEMGPKVGMYVNKSQTLSLALGVNPLVKDSATPPAGGSAASWSGWGYQAEVSFAPQISKHTWLGIKLMYDSVSFSSSETSSGATSSVSYSASSLLPMVFLSWRFN